MVAKTFSFQVFICGCLLVTVTPTIKAETFLPAGTGTTTNDNICSTQSFSSTVQQQTSRDDSSFTARDLPLSPPSPPQDVPLRFLNACGGDFAEAQRRYMHTLQWRRDNNIGMILREPFPDFFLIKQHYPHYYHLTGLGGEPVYYEFPAKTNLRELKKAGVGFDKLLRHYNMIAEYQWQMINRDDFMTSILILDLDGIRLSDFVGETVELVKQASRVAAAHYPERAGLVFVVNVPRWFHLIWKALRPIVPENTLKKIFILRGQDDILSHLIKHIPVENIPQEYGGSSPMPLGQAPEEEQLANLMQHNLLLENQKMAVCQGCSHDKPVEHWPCRFCSWTPARSY
jgi:hypothetical protein